jgi:hypothetical protein
VPEGVGVHKAIGAALALLFGLAAARALPADLGLTVAASPAARGQVIAAALASFASQSYGRLLQLGPEGRDGSVAVALTRDGGRLQCITELRRGEGRPRSLTSTLPADSAAALIPALAGDIAYLWHASAGFSGLKLENPPGLIGRLSAGTLAVLTGRPASEMELVAIASGRDGLVLCFPRGYVTLGPQFTVTARTMQDLARQAEGSRLPLLSGAAAGDRGEMVLLSEKEGRLLRVLPGRETPLGVTASGLTGSRARVAPGAQLAVLGAGGLALYGLDAAAVPPRAVPVGAFPTALGSDGEGNLWIYDAAERRIRVVGLSGAEVFSIRPLVSPSAMPLPQSLCVLPDGSFLLGGSGQLWCFLSTGVPLWKLDRIPGIPREPLPAGFDLAADPVDGSFYLLDAPSRRVLQFAGRGSPEAARAAERILAGADPASPASLGAASSALRAAGLPLMAVDVLSASGGRGPRAEGAAAAADLAREKAMRAAELVDALTRDLLGAQAQNACAAAVGHARTLRAQAPADDEAARLLDRLTTRLAELRESAAAAADLSVRISGEPAPAVDACGTTLSIRCIVQGAPAVDDVRLSLTLPGASRAPGRAALASLSAGEEAALDIQVALEPGSRPPWDPAARLDYLRAGQARSAFFRPAWPQAQEAGGRRSASELACAARAADSLVEEFARSTASGATPLAGVLAAIDVLQAAADPGLPAAGASSLLPAGELLPARAALRGLAAGQMDWAVLVAGIARTLGCPSGIMVAASGVFPLIRTGSPVSEAGSLFPSTPEAAAVLRAVSRDGELVLPLAPAREGGAAGCLLRAVGLLAPGDASSADTAWLENAAPDQGGAAGPPAPFPLVFPLRPAGS